MASLVAGPMVGAAFGTAWAAQTFPDVPPNHTFFKEVEWGAQHGIINGFPDGTFRPGQSVTRGQAAAFLSHYNDAIHLQVATSNPQPNTVFGLSAHCPQGERAIGGVGNHNSLNLFMSDTYLDGREFRVRWETENNATVDPSQLRVTAVCVPGTAGSVVTGSSDPVPDKPEG